MATEHARRFGLGANVKIFGSAQPGSLPEATVTPKPIRRPAIGLPSLD